MHIPDGMLDPKVSTGSAFAAAAVIGYCIARVRMALQAAVPEAVLAGIGNVTSTVKSSTGRIAENHFTRMLAVGSILLMVQLFDFPIMNGTSGHILGGIFAAVALGPFSGTITMASVLAVQAFLLSDGGIAAIGANILSMAVIGTFACYYIYFATNKLMNNKIGCYLGICLASFLSVLLSAAAVSFQISLSGSVLEKVISPMLSVHMIVGIAEALATVTMLDILSFLKFNLEGKTK